jgi:hypothetical protein
MFVKIDSMPPRFSALPSLALPSKLLATSPNTFSIPNLDSSFFSAFSHFLVVFASVSAGVFNAYVTLSINEQTTPVAICLDSLGESLQ